MKTYQWIVCVAFLLVSVASCGKDKLVLTTCDEPQAYQAVVPGKKVVVPDDLDPLDELKEIAVPKAESQPRPAGSRCIESPPSVVTGA